MNMNNMDNLAERSNTDDFLDNNQGFLNEGGEEFNNQNKLINHLEDINEQFYDLVQRVKKIEMENKYLNKQLELEKNKNKKIPPNNLQIFENSINQGKILLNDIKKKNAQLTEKIEIIIITIK